MEKINEIKSWVFEKINKVDKLLARLIYKNKSAQINKTRNEKEVTSDTTEMDHKELLQATIYIYANKMDSLEEMDTFL